MATLARPDVRWMACLLLALLGLGYVACELPSRAIVPAASSASAVDWRPEDPWRRTAAGWELRTRWVPAAPAAHYPLHPLVVAALQVLLSVFALVAFPGRRSAHDSTKGQPSRSRRGDALTWRGRSARRVPRARTG